MTKRRRRSWFFLRFIAGVKGTFCAALCCCHSLPVIQSDSYFFLCSQICTALNFIRSFSLSFSFFHFALWRQKFEAIVAERLQRQQQQPLWALAVMENHITRSPMLAIIALHCCSARMHKKASTKSPNGDGTIKQSKQTAAAIAAIAATAKSQRHWPTLRLLHHYHEMNEWRNENGGHFEGTMCRPTNGWRRIQMC